MWQCDNCGKTFPVVARISTERRPLPGFSPDVTRTLVEKACCPFCESIQFHEVKETKPS